MLQIKAVCIQSFLLFFSDFDARAIPLFRGGNDTGVLKKFVGMKVFRILLSLLVAFQINPLIAQPCNDEALLKIPGVWKKGKQGSIENVMPEDLAKEKLVLEQMYKMISSKYSPFGCDIVHSTVFGYNRYKGKNWKCDPYEFSIYVKDYLCDHKDNDISKKWVDPETGTTLYFNVNHIWSREGGFEMRPADLPDDHYYPGYQILKKWPEKKDGYYYWKNHSPTEREKYIEYQFLITYDGKLPFKPFTRREYLLVKIPELKKFVAELEANLKNIDPNLDRASKDAYAEGQRFIAEKKKLTEDTENLLRTMSAEELNMGAVVKGSGAGDFTGFKDENDDYVDILVKPDLAYYKHLPKWVPQFFCINVNIETYREVFGKNVKEIEKAIDFSWFRNMLGNTTIIPAGN
jgi:hypothetical protein